MNPTFVDTSVPARETPPPKNKAGFVELFTRFAAYFAISHAHFSKKPGCITKKHLAPVTRFTPCEKERKVEASKPRTHPIQAEASSLVLVISLISFSLPFSQGTKQEAHSETLGPGRARESDLVLECLRLEENLPPKKETTKEGGTLLAVFFLFRFGKEEPTCHFSGLQHEGGKRPSMLDCKDFAGGDGELTWSVAVFSVRVFAQGGRNLDRLVGLAARECHQPALRHHKTVLATSHRSGPPKMEGHLIFFGFLFWMFFVFRGFWLLWLLAFVAFGFRGFRGFWLLASVASGFCGFWLLWLLASVASGFCGFWLSWLSWLLWLLAFVAFGFLAYPSICLYLSIYLSIYLSFFLAAVLLSLFVFAFPVVFVAETKPDKEASKQASRQASTSCSPLDLVCCWGGELRPPPNPPRATKSALHPQHPRLPRNQYFKVNPPVQNFLTKQICLLYLSIYLI